MTATKLSNCFHGSTERISHSAKDTLMRCSAVGESRPTSVFRKESLNRQDWKSGSSEISYHLTLWLHAFHML